MTPQFQTKPFYLWPIAVISAAVFVPIINHQTYTLEYVITVTLLIYFVSIFSLRSFQFYDAYFNRFYPTRLGFLKRNTRFEYTELFLVEIRKREGPYQRPYVIFHFNEKKVNSKFFIHRAFIYKNSTELLPLLDLLVKRNVKIKVNMTKKYKEDYDQIIELIGDNQYISADK
ncbi:MAG: hypothetical protein ACI9JN_002875 [Bacteroidia bacterium]|jgi:hypothetical protein